MSDRIVILGAGGLSLGFFGPELRNEYNLTFLDTHFKADLVSAIQRTHAYTTNLAGADIEPVSVEQVDAFRLDLPEHDAAIREHLDQARIFFTAVGLRNLDKALTWLNERIRRRKDDIYILCAENGEDVAEKWRAQFPPNIHLSDTVMGRMCRVEENAAPDYTPVHPQLPWAVVGEAFYGMPLPDEINNPEVFHSDAFIFCPEKEFHARDRIKLFAHNGLHFFIAVHGRLRNVERFSDMADDPQITTAARQLLHEEIAPALWKDCGEHLGRIPFDDYMDKLPGRLFSKTLRDQVARGIRGVDLKFAPNERVMGGLRLLLDNGIQPDRYYDLIAAGLQVASLEISRETAEGLLENLPAGEVRNEVSKRWKALAP